MGSSQGKLLLIGLDNSGKTTILSRIMNPDTMKTDITPTIGYKKQTFNRNGIDFQVFDMSGQAKYREFWQQNANRNANKIDGIIFVVDASDKMRINYARQELQLIVDNKDIPSDIPFLFYLNKVDVKGSCKKQEMKEIMKLKELKRNFMIYQCSGLTGMGVQQGIGWLSQYLKPIIDNR